MCFHHLQVETTNAQESSTRKCSKSCHNISESSVVDAPLELMESASPNESTCSTPARDAEQAEQLHWEKLFPQIWDVCFHQGRKDAVL